MRLSQTPYTQILHKQKSITCATNFPISPESRHTQQASFDQPSGPARASVFSAFCEDGCGADCTYTCTILHVCYVCWPAPNAGGSFAPGLEILCGKVGLASDGATHHPPKHRSCSKDCHTQQEQGQRRKGMGCERLVEEHISLLDSSLYIYISFIYTRIYIYIYTPASPCDKPLIMIHERRVCMSRGPASTMELEGSPRCWKERRLLSGRKWVIPGPGNRWFCA